MARTAADIVGSDGRVVGVDLNEAMLTVAARVRPDLEWRQGDVARLPFADGEFDAVLCQMALMFFPDRTRALREMSRVVTTERHRRGLRSRESGRPARVRTVRRDGGPPRRAGGRLAAEHLLVVRRPRSADRRSSSRPGFASRRPRTVAGVARFASPEELVATEVESTPLIDRISDQVYAQHPGRGDRGAAAVRDGRRDARRTARRAPRRRSTRQVTDPERGPNLRRYLGAARAELSSTGAGSDSREHWTPGGA